MGFNAFVLAMLALDLGVFHRTAHVVGFRESMTWTVVWVVLALLFNAGIWHFSGSEKALEFFTGYVIEKSLSVHNVFVFAMLFAYFAVPPLYQHKVLVWGVLGAPVMRAAIAEHVCRIIEEVTYRGAGTQVSPLSSLESMVVQDADRLDAIGAIGIARAFAYGGYKERPLHNPLVAPQFHTSFEEYKTSNSATINHFYEKLLLLRDRMRTETARRIASGRHAYMEEYLQLFLREWDGVD